MRKLFLGATALTATAALSGCSFLGIGGHDDYRSYDRTSSYYGAQPVQAAPKPCNSQQCLARWNFEGGIGPAFIVGGDVVSGDGTNDGSGGVVRNISWDTAYDEGIRGELGGSYALNPNTKVTAMGFYEKAESAGVLDWGTINDDALSGSLSDYESYGAELGLRKYFAPSRAPIVKTVRPYVEGRLGASYVEDINIENATLAGDAFNAGTVPFYDNSWVGSAAGLVGIETPLTRYSTIALETGVRYQGALDSNNSVLAAGTPIAGVNNGDGRVTVPLMLRGRYRF